MWARCLHTLAPLTKITPNKRKYKWTKIEQDDFDEIRRNVDRNTLLNYPDFIEELKIQIDANKFQLVVVISQDGKPITFYIRNLTESDISYTVT